MARTQMRGERAPGRTQEGCLSSEAMQGVGESEPRLSVALVTRNRPASLSRTLRCLAAQDAPPWEIVVSDDSDEAHANETAKVVGRFGFRYLRGPRRGLYANRNFAALACTGTHVRTMDDDHEFGPEHLRLCLEGLQRDPQSVWIIGETHPSERVWKQICPGQLHPRGFSVEPADPDDCCSISDGATIYPASIFRKGIRFAECYKFGAAYLEFGARLHWLGYRIRFLPTTSVFHNFDVEKRSFHDPHLDRASRYFAMLCLSFLYHPTFRNKALHGLQIVREIVSRNGYASWRSALSAYRDHKKVVLLQAAEQFAAP